MNAVDAVHSGCSMQWMQWNSGIWWWGHCLWCKKVKPVDAVCDGYNGIVVYGGGIVFDTRRSKQWMQYAVHSGIVVYGCGNIVFGAKRSNQWMHWMQYTVDAVCSGSSGIVVYGGGIVFDRKRSIQWRQYTVHS